MADNPDVCVLCSLRIEGSRIGAGDGTGQKFAHPECYWRNEAAKLQAFLAARTAERDSWRESAQAIAADRDMWERAYREWMTLAGTLEQKVRTLEAELSLWRATR